MKEQNEGKEPAHAAGRLHAVVMNDAALSRSEFVSPLLFGATADRKVIVIRGYSVWENLKLMLSDNCLKWAVQLLPLDCEERKELAKFLHAYLKRSIARNYDS